MEGNKLATKINLTDDDKKTESVIVKHGDNWLNTKTIKIVTKIIKKIETHEKTKIDNESAEVV